MGLKTFPSEIQEYKDPVTGIRMRQLTHHLAHSWHFYFTDSAWWDNNKKLLFKSHRNNHAGIYSIELDSGEITQIAENITADYLNPKRNEVYGTTGTTVKAVDIETGETRDLYEEPEGFHRRRISCTADGNFLCVCLLGKNEIDISQMNQGYVNFKEYFESKPLCRIEKVSVDTGKTETVHEDQCWIGHVNTSPTKADLLSFCHEGPWGLVEQRMWGLDINTGKTWAIRKQESTDSMGHEYWLADGESLGYHGRTKDGPVFGFTKYDNTEWVEAPFPDDSCHFQSNTREFIVGDGSGIPYCLMWRFDGTAFEGPRVLCKHRSSFHIQETHVHPRFSPDNDYVLFTSDRTGYGNVYQAFLPDFEMLPTLEHVKGKK